MSIPGSRTTFQTHKLLNSRKITSVDSDFIICETFLAHPRQKMICDELNSLLPQRPKRVFLHNQFEGTNDIRSRDWNPTHLTVSILE